jgi:hypothetical protein
MIKCYTEGVNILIIVGAGVYGNNVLWFGLTIKIALGN